MDNAGSHTIRMVAQRPEDISDDSGRLIDDCREDGLLSGLDICELTAIKMFQDLNFFGRLLLEEFDPRRVGKHGDRRRKHRSCTVWYNAA